MSATIYRRQRKCWGALVPPHLTATAAKLCTWRVVWLRCGTMTQSREATPSLQQQCGGPEADTPRGGVRTAGNVAHLGTGSAYQPAAPSPLMTSKSLCQARQAQEPELQSLSLPLPFLPHTETLDIRAVPVMNLAFSASLGPMHMVTQGSLGHFCLLAPPPSPRLSSGSLSNVAWADDTLSTLDPAPSAPPTPHLLLALLPKGA